MASSAFRIHGTGHGWADYIYSETDFSTERAKPYKSVVPGDGGLTAGKLIFKEDFLKFAGCSWEQALTDLKASSRRLDISAGPALVALTSAAQFLKPSKVPATYYGLSGDDIPGSQLRHILAQTPLDLTCFRQRTGISATRIVCSESQAHSDQVEPFFVHDPGTVVFDPSHLGESFFQATFNVYAGTALLPDVQLALPALLAKGHHRGAINIVATVFDYAAEKQTPDISWNRRFADLFPKIDLLIAHAWEIRKLAGHADIEKCVAILMDQGLTAAIITQGTDPVYYCSRGGIFGQSQGFLPVHASLAVQIRQNVSNATDHQGMDASFLGGVLADLMLQILADDFYPKGEIHIERELLQICPLRLRHAVEFGSVAGALARLHNGGIKMESVKGEHLALVRKYFPDSTPVGRPW